ncbi:MFS transporter [Thermogemmatispora sp.]|uniref:MFS transporter n=1 Tax=Thermogemmatispora sp. TaxID=1968838 RepID=UPI0035E4105A
MGAEDLARATSLSQATMGLSVIIGPAIGSLLVFNFGIQWAVIADALSFAVSFLTIALIDVPVEKRLGGGHVSFGQDSQAGLGVLVDNRGLLAVLLASLLSMSAFGALNALAIFFVTDNLHAHAHPDLYGPLGTVLGLGAIAGALIAGLIASRLGLARLLWGASLLLGLTTLLLARMISVGPAFGLIFLVGAAWIAVNVAVELLVLRLTARDFVGRVTAVLTPAGSLAPVLSAALAGALVSTVLHDFHARLLGLTFVQYPQADRSLCNLNTSQYPGCGGIGALVLLGSLVVRLLMHDVHFLDEQPGPEMPALAPSRDQAGEAETQDSQSGRAVHNLPPLPTHLLDPVTSRGASFFQPGQLLFKLLHPLTA